MLLDVRANDLTATTFSYWLLCYMSELVCCKIAMVCLGVGEQREMKWKSYFFILHHPNRPLVIVGEKLLSSHHQGIVLIEK